jgi:hypothetical protein
MHASGQCGTVQPGLECVKPKDADEGLSMGGEPLSRRLAQFTGDNRAIERGELVEANHRRHLESCARDGAEGRHVRTGAQHRGDEADHEIGPAVVIARHHEGRAPLVPGKVGEGEPGEDDAAEREHSVCAFDQVSVAIEVRLVGQPVVRSAGFGQRRHRQGLVLEQLDDDMHFGVRGNATACKFGRELPRRGVDNDLLHAIWPFLRADPSTTT